VKFHEILYGSPMYFRVRWIPHVSYGVCSHDTRWQFRIDWYHYFIVFLWKNPGKWARRFQNYP
jgi:hypothetical protein